MTAPTMFVLGVRNHTWSGAALPIHMGNSGFPGCFLNISYTKVFGLASDNTGRLAIPVQTTNVPPGARLCSQIMVPPPNGTKIAVSQGYELTVHKSVNPFRVAVLADTQSYVVNSFWATNWRRPRSSRRDSARVDSRLASSSTV